MEEIGIIMNGVTGRMGTNQHLIRSIIAIRNQGGITLKNGKKIQLDPILVGRDEQKVSLLAKQYNINRWSTNLDETLKGKDKILFDSASTILRPDVLNKGIKAGKHIYCEKPSAYDLKTAIELTNNARNAKVKHGVVQDKLYLPGLLKLKDLIHKKFFGNILSIKIDFGYWVFTGEKTPSQRPSWNYRKQDGGGIIIDMMCHWQYILEGLLGKIKSISCLGATHINKRWDENSQAYQATSDDAAYAIIEMKNGVIAQLNSSWCTRVRKDDLVTFQIDGTNGSAVAGLTKCYIQPLDKTPRPIWNPDKKQTHNFYEDWQLYRDNEIFDNGFKLQWEDFLRYVLEDGQWNFGLEKGAQAVQIAELALKSWEKRCWVDITPLDFS